MSAAGIASALLVAATVGCQATLVEEREAAGRPEPIVEEPALPAEPEEPEPPAVAEPVVVPEDIQEEPAAREPRGFSLPGTLVTIETWSPGAVLEAVAEVAGAVQPGVGMMMRQLVAMQAGCNSYEELKSLLVNKPATFLILNPAAHHGWIACAIGAEDADFPPELVVKAAGMRGLAVRPEGGDFLIEAAPEQAFVFRLVDGWLVGAMSRETLNVAAEAVEAGAVPRGPADGNHVTARVNVVEIRKAYGIELDQALTQMRAVFAVGPQAAENPVLGRFMDEYVMALAGIVGGLDEYILSLKLSAEAVEITQRLKPTAGGVFDPLAKRPGAARWTVCDVLPRDAPLSVAMRLDYEAFRPLAEALLKGLLRVAAVEEDDAERLRDLLATIERDLAGAESVFAVTKYTAAGVTGIGATTTDFETYRGMQRQGIECVSLLDELWEALEFEMKMEYQADAGRLEGRPVDRMVTSVQPVGPNAEAMEEAMLQFGGESRSVMEFVGTPEGVIYASGDAPRKSLEEAIERRRQSAAFEGKGWATASAELRKLLERAPDRTWCAGEMRLGAYVAMVLAAMAQNAPGGLPDATALTENDPPVAFWLAAEGGGIVSSARIPIVSVKNVVTFFMQFKGAMGGGDVEVQEEDFDDFDFDFEGGEGKDEEAW